MGAAVLPGRYKSPGKIAGHPQGKRVELVSLLDLGDALLLPPQVDQILPVQIVRVGGTRAQLDGALQFPLGAGPVHSEILQFKRQRRMGVRQRVVQFQSSLAPRPWLWASRPSAPRTTGKTAIRKRHLGVSRRVARILLNRLLQVLRWPHKWNLWCADQVEPSPEIKARTLGGRPGGAGQRSLSPGLGGCGPGSRCLALPRLATAIQKDPSYAPADAQMSFAYSQAFQLVRARRRDAQSQGRGAASLELDDSLAGRPYALRLNWQNFEWTGPAPTGTEARHRAEPSSSDAHYLYGEYLVKPAAAGGGHRRDRAGSPTRPAFLRVASDLTWALVSARSTAAPSRAEAVDRAGPWFPVGYVWSGMAYSQCAVPGSHCRPEEADELEAQPTMDQFSGRREAAAREQRGGPGGCVAKLEEESSAATGAPMKSRRCMRNSERTTQAFSGCSATA